MFQNELFVTSCCKGTCCGQVLADMPAHPMLYKPALNIHLLEGIVLDSELDVMHICLLIYLVQATAVRSLWPCQSANFMRQGHVEASMAQVPWLLSSSGSGPAQQEHQPLFALATHRDIACLPCAWLPDVLGQVIRLLQPCSLPPAG